MIWLIVLGAVGLTFAVGAVLRSRASQAPSPDQPVAPATTWADKPVPRDASILERVSGVAVAGAALLAVAALMAGMEEPLGPLVTAPALAVVLGLGALIAAGPRGRDRFGTALFESNRRLVGAQGNYRFYRYTGDKDRRLRALGGEPTVMVLLALGAVVMLAKPFITPNVERTSSPVAAPSGPPGMPPMTAAMRAELEAAAAAGDPRAIAMRAMLGEGDAGPSAHFTVEGYTTERNVAWPLTALVLSMIALRLLLTPASLSPRRAT